jgi:Co/Zn/Cd efflux system component
MAVQAVFALIANSESMLADSEAMSVDALTYLFNMCAERIKKQPYSEHELSLSKPIRERRRTMKRLYLELVPPFISVTTLIAVTVVCLRDSYLKLFGEDGEYDSTEQVDVGLMLIFSALNLLLDIVNVACFARADQAFGLPSMSGFDAQPSVDFVRMSTRGGFEVELQGDDFAVTEASPLNANDSSPPEDTFYGINLNMCSAWTVSNNKNMTVRKTLRIILIY